MSAFDETQDMLAGNSPWFFYEWSWKEFLSSLLWVDALCVILGSILYLITILIGPLGVLDWPRGTVIALLSLACIYRFYWSLYRYHIGLKVGPVTCLLYIMMFMAPFWVAIEVVGRFLPGACFLWKILLWSVVSVFPFFLIKAIVRVTLRLENAISQTIRDRRARKAVDAVTGSEGDGAAAAFSLYLRPFYVTRELPVAGSAFVNLDYKDETLPADLETVLETAVEPFAPLIGLGRPNEAVGAGRIKVEDRDWQSVIRLLIEKAALIFIIPSERSGTLWEIAFLKERCLLDHCLFIMPATTVWFDISVWIPWWPFGRRRLDYGEDDWARACQAVNRLGIELPSYNQFGMVFRVDDGGQVCEGYHITLLSNPMAVPHLREAIARVLGSNASVREI